MNQYCRYCTALTTGNGIWCNTRKTTLPEPYTKQKNFCKDFEFCEIDAYDLEHKYKPRVKRNKQTEGQINIFDLGVSK